MEPPYAIGLVPSLSGHAIAYRWRSLPKVRRHRASKPQGSSERVLPWQITMDQLIFASLSHTHYWYEVGMLKVPTVRIVWFAHKNLNASKPFKPLHLSLRNLVLGYECGRVFPVGVGPDSPSRDATNWLSSRFSLSVETRRRFGWLTMISTRCGTSRAPIWCPFGRSARGRWHCREKTGTAARSSTSQESAESLCVRAKGANREVSEGKADF